MDIKDARAKIDAIDDQITQLFVERMSVVDEIAKIKSESNLPTINGLREREVVVRQTSKMPDDIKLFGKQLYQTLFGVSKAYQSQKVVNDSKIVQEIKNAVKDGLPDFPTAASVACQGVAGAYSQIAADKMFGIANISYFKDWNGVFNAVEKGFCQYGVLPIENSSVGSVNEVYDLMRKHDFHIVKCYKMRVSHYLLAKRGVELKDVKEIFSHEKAVAQCKEFLKTCNAKVTICDNTALAAKMVAESERTDVACISSRECADIYGLGVVVPNVHDADNNFTRLIAIAKDLKVFKGANKISIMANLPHEAGSLNTILTKFSTLGLNLTKLESRPILNSAFEFAFYFDIEADVMKQEVQNLIAELESTCEKLVFLGSYEEKY